MTRQTESVDQAVQAIQTLAGKVELLRNVPSVVRAQRWWVLICGEPLDPSSFEAREAARERLRANMTERGLTLAEYVWVWDEADLAQALAGEFPSVDAARLCAETLAAQGFAVRIRPDMPPSPNV